MTCDIIPNRLFQNHTYFIFMWLLLLFSVPLDRNSTSKVSSGVSSYRMLFDMGFKKEDIELALRATNYNLEEAIELLNQSRSANSIDAWRRHDDHNAGAGNFEHNNFPQRYPGGPQQAMSFQVSTPQTRCRMAVTISIILRMNQANQNIMSIYRTTIQIYWTLSASVGLVQIQVWMQSATCNQCKHKNI